MNQINVIFQHKPFCLELCFTLCKFYFFINSVFPLLLIKVVDQGEIKHITDSFPNDEELKFAHNPANPGRSISYKFVASNDCNMAVTLVSYI